MKKLILFGVISIISYSIYSQNKGHAIEGKFHSRNDKNYTRPVKLDSLYFILGTLSDYLGRFQYVDREGQIDRYFVHEKPLVDFLMNYIEEKFNITPDTILLKSGIYKMYSSELAKKLNSFYGENDRLIKSKFETNQQICSFLTGVYYRDGMPIDSIICKIKLTNSPKNDNCYELLKKLRCERIFYEYIKTIPAHYVFYFEPTEELREYFDIVEPERILLQESNDQSLIDWFENMKIPDEYEENFLERSKARDTERIKNLFWIKRNKIVD